MTHIILEFPILCILKDLCVIRVSFCNISLYYWVYQGLNDVVPYPSLRDVEICILFSFIS